MHGRHGSADGPTWISLHRVRTWAFQRAVESLESDALTRFVVWCKDNYSKVEAERDRELSRSAQAVSLVLHVAIFGVWNGTIADLGNLKFIQIVRLYLVAGHGQGYGNGTWCLLWCEQGYGGIVHDESDGRNYERGLTY